MSILPLVVLCLCAAVTTVYGSAYQSQNGMTLTFKQHVGCVMACKRGAKVPFYCDCPQYRSCETMKCRDQHYCKSLGGMIPVCVANKEACQMDKPYTWGCGNSRSSYYYEAETRRCRSLGTGQCSTNLNFFADAVQCTIACRMP